MTDAPAPAPCFDLRPGRAEDFAFARALYFDSMKPLLSALDAWDAEAIETAFQSYYIPAEVQVVTQNGRDVGWIQVSEIEPALCLDQLHLIEDVRNQGIGSALIADVVARATAKGKNVRLSLVKGNPALRLYKRLGFTHMAEEDTKLHMRLVIGG